MNGDVARLERLSLEVWPPAERVPLDGWELCWSGGTTRRTNSVQPLADGGMALDDKLGRCERHFADRGARLVFKLTEESRPPGLDDELGARGFARADPTCVEILDLAGPGSDGADPGVRIDDELGARWFAQCVALNQVAEGARPALRGILERLPGERAFAALFDGDAADAPAFAVGLGVLHRDHLFLGEIATHAAQRRRGLARRVVAATLDWGRRRGARRAFLQVVAANAPARALYAELGFREAYRYWYREAGGVA